MLEELSDTWLGKIVGDSVTGGPEERAARLQQKAARQQQRSTGGPEERAARLQHEAARQQQRRASEGPEEKAMSKVTTPISE